VQIKFSSKGWDDYLYWQATDKAMLKKINMLIKEIEREPFTGKGKPEPLKHQLSGFWSRRIDLQHRLVYALEGILDIFPK
jgi:toxin YoeB